MGPIIISPHIISAYDHRKNVSEVLDVTHHDPQGLEYTQVPLLQAQEDQPEVLNVLLVQVGCSSEISDCGRFCIK